MIVAKSNITVSATGLFEELKKEKKKLIASKVILDKKDNHSYPIVDIPFEIPSHWVWCYLSDISLIQEGPGIRKHQYATSGVQFLTVTNILEGSVDLIKSKKYISKEQYKNYSHFTINKGDIVTACSGGSWGKSAIYELDEKLILNTSTLRLRFYNDLGDNYYLYYLTKTSYFKDSLSKYITGQQPNYGYSHYSKIPIPLPPLPEQQRIVAILDEAFAAIAKAKANAEQNLKNAKELFESYLQGVFENGNENWETKCLDELGTITSSKRIYKSEYIKDGVPFYRTKEIKELSNGKSITLELFISRNRYNEIKKSFGVPQINDLLMSAVGTIGEIMVIENNDEFYFKDGNIVWFKGFKSLDTNYLKFALTAFVEKIKSLAIGAAYSALTIEKLNKYQISFPKTIKEQQTIVQKLDALSNETKKLEAIYQQKINDLEELKKSILKKAFSGELNAAKELII